MNSETDRILKEYERRAKEIPGDFYSLDNPAILFGYCQRIRNLIGLLKEQNIFPIKNLRILDVGCGGGRWLFDFLAWGAQRKDLAGIDLLEKRVEDAKRLLPGADIKQGNADNLPWNDEYFDIVMQSVVFSSILDPVMKKRVASEMLRVLKADGLIIWLDMRFNNPRNPNVKRIEAGEIRELFPNTDIKLRKVTLAPPISRKIVKFSWISALLLEKIPLLKTHYLGAIRKAAPAGKRNSPGC